MNLVVLQASAGAGLLGLAVGTTSPAAAQVVNPANGHTYFESPTLMRAIEAETWAQSLAGHLVTINDEAEQLWILTTFGTSRRYWIGLTDSEAFGGYEAGNDPNSPGWVWMSGEPVTYGNWEPGEPNNHQGNEDFVETRTLGRWNDLADSKTRWAIAEINTNQRAELYTDETSWRSVVFGMQAFDFTPANVALANEISSPPSSGANLGTSVLTFPRGSSGLTTDLQIRTLGGPAYPWIYDAPQIAGFNHLSPGEINVSPEDDWEVVTFPGHPVTALAFTVQANDGPGDVLDVYSRSGWLASFPIPTPVGGSEAFLGVATSEPIVSLRFNSEPGGDDIAIANLRFGAVRRITHRIDIEIAYSSSPEIPVGFYPGAGYFAFRSSLLPSPGERVLIEWDQMVDLECVVGAAAVDVNDIPNATCLHVSQFPACGVLFEGNQYVQVVDQFLIPESATAPRWLIRFNNSGGSNFTTIGDYHLGVIVAGGPITFVRIPTECSGDIDGNGLVDEADLLLLFASWGPCPPVCIGDVNGDGVVDVLDLLELLAAWGPCP